MKNIRFTGKGLGGISVLTGLGDLHEPEIDFR